MFQIMFVDRFPGITDYDWFQCNRLRTSNLFYVPFQKRDYYSTASSASRYVNFFLSQNILENKSIFNFQFIYYLIFIFLNYNYYNLL